MSENVRYFLNETVSIDCPRGSPEGYRGLNSCSSRLLKGLCYTDAPVILVVLVLVVLLGLKDVSVVSECVSGDFENKCVGS